MKTLCIFLILAASSTFCQGATVTVVPSTASLVAGNSFTVDVRIDTAVPVYAWELTLTYNGLLISGSSAAEGAFLPAGGGTTFFSLGPDNVLGQFGPASSVLNGAVPGVVGTGTLVTFTFQALSPGNVSLGVLGLSLLDETLFNIAATTTGATVEVRPSAAAIPEPATWMLLAPIALVVLARKKLNDLRPMVSTRRS